MAIRTGRARRKRFGHHALFRELEARYVKAPGDVAALVTRERWKQRILVTIDARFFRELVRAWRARAGK
jgi:hypothetical protein